MVETLGGRTKAAPSPGERVGVRASLKHFFKVGRVNPLRAGRPQTNDGAHPASAGRPANHRADFSAQLVAPKSDEGGSRQDAQTQGKLESFFASPSSLLKNPPHSGERFCTE